jgi:hypothetical protein
MNAWPAVFEITIPQIRYSRPTETTKGQLHYYIQLHKWMYYKPNKITSYEIDPKNAKDALEIYELLVGEWLSYVFKIFASFDEKDGFSTVNCLEAFSALIKTKYPDAGVGIFPREPHSDESVDWKQVARKQNRNFYFSVCYPLYVSITVISGNWPEVVIKINTETEEQKVQRLRVLDSFKGLSAQVAQSLTILDKMQEQNQVHEPAIQCMQSATQALAVFDRLQAKLEKPES